MIKIIRNLSVIMYSAKHLTNKYEIRGLYVAIAALLLSFFTITIDYISVLGVILGIFSLLIALFSLKNIIPSDHRIEEFDFHNNRFMTSVDYNEVNINNFFKNEEYISNIPKNEKKTENEYSPPPQIYIPIYRNTILENIGVYNTELEEYISSGKKIWCINDGANSEKNILSELKSHHNDDIRKYQIMELFKRSEKRNSFYNSPKISIRSIKKSDEKFTIIIGKTSYFTSVITNDFFCNDIYLNSCITDPYKKLSQYFPANLNQETKAWSILDFDKCSHLSNHIGSAVLALTKDDIPIIQTQRINAQQNSGKIQVSGAGSLELNDFKTINKKMTDASFCDFIKYGMSRELLEETGLINEDSKEEDDIKTIIDFSQTNLHLLSLYRDVLRGGLPIFLGFSRMNNTFSELKNLKNKETIFAKDIKTKINSSTSMIEFLDNFISSNEHSNKVSTQFILFRNLLKIDSVKKRFDKTLFTND